MRGGTHSFEVRTERTERVVQVALDHWRRLTKPRTGVLFVSGRLTARLAEIAARLAESLSEPGLSQGAPPETPGARPTWLVAGGVGVLTERGEIERQSAATGLVLSGGASAGVSSGPRLDTFGQRLGECLARHPSGTALVLVRSDQFEEDSLEGLTATHRKDVGHRVFGGGAIADQDVYLVTPGAVNAGAGGALLLEGLGPARMAVAPACRLLGPLRRVTKTRGSMVLEIGDDRALDLLSTSAENLPDQPLVLLAVAGERSPVASAPDARAPDARAEDALVDRAAPTDAVVLRAIQGVDPTRGGVLVGDGVRLGARVSFAIRDASMARASLNEQLRHLAGSCAGSAPRFGIYVNCAGRGQTLYGNPDVDTKIVKARFGDLPLVGLQTAFELAPFEDRVALQLYTGVLGLFCTPS